jgi:hypothetical protein
LRENYAPIAQGLEHNAYNVGVTGSIPVGRTNTSMDTKTQQLIEKARTIMLGSQDPIHDIDHVERVVAYTRNLATNMNLNQAQTEALILAAWWHDTGRTITSRPSMIWMPFVDDIISALMLWRETIRCRMFGKVVGMATRMIFCKSLGTGKILSRILMRKKNRFMIDILQDADTLDMLSIERTERIYLLATNSTLYTYGYKLIIWWLLSKQQLKVKTQAAKEMLQDLLERFLTWIKKQHIFNWHVETFGRTWTYTQMHKAEQLLASISSSSIITLA